MLKINQSIKKINFQIKVVILAAFWHQTTTSYNLNLIH
jgi:hypothetical protein